MVSHKISSPKVIISIFMLTIFSGQVVRSQSERITPPRAAIDISSINNSDLVIELDLNKGSTLKEVSRYFNVTEATLTKHNKGKFKANKVQTGEINLHIQAIQVLSKPFVGSDKVVAPYCQLFYTVQKGENLFTIATKYLDKDLKVIQQLNNLSSTELKVGQRLLIGYLRVYPLESKQTKQAKTNDDKLKKEDKAPLTIKPAKTAIKNDAKNKKEDKNGNAGKSVATSTKENNTPATLVRKDVTSIKQITKETPKAIKTDKPEAVEDEIETSKVVTKSVVAMWDKNGSESESLFVLHNDAKVGSTIQIYFPMMKSKVNAKVLGKIPSGTYNDDISLFVSPAVAKELGILDTKAHLVVRYFD